MIIVDTGPLVALVNSSDADHERCAEWIEIIDEPLLVPNTVLTEVCYLLQRKCGSKIEARFLRDLAADDRFTLIPILREDLYRVAELVETYEDFPLGGADASVIAVAERLGVESQPWTAGTSRWCDPDIWRLSPSYRRSHRRPT